MNDDNTQSVIIFIVIMGIAQMLFTHYRISEHKQEITKEECSGEK